MKNLSLALLLLFTLPTEAQWIYRQLFDGADTAAHNSLFMQIDSNSIWQIGSPRFKRTLRAPATSPNVIITDTLHSYPINDSSSFEFDFTMQVWNNGIVALEWMQRLDFEDSADFGFIHFRASDTAAWQNVFNNSFVYNVFGFDSVNLKRWNGEWGFTGRSDMQNVWVCLDLSWLSQVSPNGKVYFRYSILSDSVATNHDGWIIDNMAAHLTAFHTINEEEMDQFMIATPNPSRGKISLKTRKNGTVQYIESIELIDLSGQVLKRWGLSPSKFEIDISDQKPGTYILKVNTNLQKEEFRIILQN